MEQTLDLPERRTESAALKAKWIWSALAMAVVASAVAWARVERSRERDKPVVSKPRRSVAGGSKPR
jgi:hypothetical protein